MPRPGCPSRQFLPSQAGTTWPGRDASMISSARSREPADLEDLPRVGADLERPSIATCT